MLLRAFRCQLKFLQNIIEIIRLLGLVLDMDGHSGKLTASDCVDSDIASGSAHSIGRLRLLDFPECSHITTNTIAYEGYVCVYFVCVDSSTVSVSCSRWLGAGPSCPYQLRTLAVVGAWFGLGGMSKSPVLLYRACGKRRVSISQ